MVTVTCDIPLRAIQAHDTSQIQKRTSRHTLKLQPLRLALFVAKIHLRQNGFEFVSKIRVIGGGQFNEIPQSPLTAGQTTGERRIVSEFSMKIIRNQQIECRMSKRAQHSRNGNSKQKFLFHSDVLLPLTTTQNICIISCGMPVVFLAANVPSDLHCGHTKQKHKPKQNKTDFNQLIKFS